MNFQLEEAQCGLLYPQRNERPGFPTHTQPCRRTSRSDARNPLLDAAMTAKIADLGKSRIINLRPAGVAGSEKISVKGVCI